MLKKKLQVLMRSEKKDCYLSNVKIMHEEIKLFLGFASFCFKVIFHFFYYTIFFLIQLH